MRKLQAVLEISKFFCPGRRMYMYALLPSMDAVFSEKRQLMKWVGMFQVGIFWEEIFWG